MLAMGGGSDDDDQPMNFFEPISYKKLMRIISTCHPIDPDSKVRFGIKERVTVKDYRGKLSDACCFYAIGNQIK